MYLDQLFVRIEGIGINFNSNAHFLSWRLLGSAALIALLISLWRSRSFKKTYRRLRRHLISRRFHRALKEDTIFYGIKMAFDPIWVLILGYSVSRADSKATNGFKAIIGDLWPGDHAIELTAAQGAVFFVVLTFVFADLGAFLVHWMYHRWSFFWNFHIVHHSATYLTPLTKYRIHPFQFILDGVVQALVVAIGVGTMSIFFKFGMSDLGRGLLYGLVFLTHSAIGNLRHSHVWVSYGPFWSRWFISPAMHQIHHSTRPEHLDKNLGVILSIWDRMAGTLYVPKRRERFPIGLVVAKRGTRLSVWKQIIRPLCVWKSGNE